jgi:molybdopterin molybdotransferase
LKSRQVIAALERHARTLDLLVTTGGVSPHGQDSLAAWIANAGGRIVFSEINVTPGRACLLARLGRCVLVALPGDPRGALVGLHFIVMPILQRMRGRPGPYIHWDEARLASPVRNHADIPRLLPGRVLPAAGGGLTVTPESERRLGSLRGVDGMNGFILLPPSMPPQAAGARVKVARFNP